MDDGKESIMYEEWIEGNKPEKVELFYWLTVRNGNCMETYPMPCRYDQKDDGWVAADGSRLSVYAVMAYYPIFLPKVYETIGTGCGYYIRANYKGEKQDTIYGFGLQPITWSGRGYDTVEKAKVALKRLRKLDEADGFKRENYEVLNGESKVVWMYN